MSVDVEDYYHVEAFADRVTPEMWGGFESRVADNTRRVLDLFARHNARATFFILGWVAEREPGLVREIAAAGHEVACHSYLHRCIFKLTKEEFRADTRRAKKILEDAAGVRVVGYRAPTFSVVERSLWAVEILAEEGFLYDSSVFPVHHDTYGIPGAPRFPYRWALAEGLTLCEIPPQTVRSFGRNWAAAGGGYLRILPMWYARWAIERVHRRDARAVNIYFHPWEIDPDQPRLKGRWKSRLRHYKNLEEMEGRLAELLTTSRFVTYREHLDAAIAAGPLPAYKPAVETATGRLVSAA